jgi:putative RNA 2'-phosphotransferase
LSLDEATALRVGERHGKAYIFRVDALAMHAKGFIFYLSDNGIWLTDRVPREFLLSS